MVQPGTTLLVKFDAQGFWFEEPVGDRLDLGRLGEKKRQAVEYLLNHRWALPAQLQERIAGHIQYNESCSGWWKQCCFGICLPSGLLLSNTFDYDRDLDPLRREVLAAAGQVLQPSDYELAEVVQSEELFSRGGKPLFRCYL